MSRSRFLLCTVLALCSTVGASRAENVQFEPDPDFWGGSVAYHGDPGRSVAAIDAAGSTRWDFARRGLLIGSSTVLVVGEAKLAAPGAYGVGAAKFTANGAVDTAFGLRAHDGCLTQVNDAALVGSTVVAIGRTGCSAYPASDWGMLAFASSDGNLVTGFDFDGRLFYKPTAGQDYVEEAVSIAALATTTFAVAGTQGMPMRTYVQRFDLSGTTVGLGWFANVPEINRPTVMQRDASGDLYVALELPTETNGKALRLMRLGPQLEPRWTQPTLATFAASEPATCRTNHHTVSAIVPETINGVPRVRVFGHGATMSYSALFDAASGALLSIRCMTTPAGFSEARIEDATPSEPGKQLVALELVDADGRVAIALGRVKHVGGVPTFDTQFNAGTPEIAAFPAGSSAVPHAYAADLLRDRSGAPYIVGSRYWAPEEDYDFGIVRFENTLPGTWE